MTSVGIRTSWMVILLAGVIASGALALAVGWMQQQRALVAEGLAAVARDAAEAAFPLHALGNAMVNDAAMLTQLPVVQAISATSAPDESQLDAAAQALAAYATHHEQVLQARLIATDSEGMELVRLERSEAGAPLHRVPAEALQPKGMRPYVRSAPLAPTVGVGRIELNREHGEIEVPHVPVLRAATVVPGTPGVVVVLNLDAGRALRAAGARLGAGRTLSVADDRGQWLVHPDPDKVFAVDRGTQPASDGLPEAPPATPWVHAGVLYGAQVTRVSPDHDVVVLVSLPVRAATASARQTAPAIVLALLLFLIPMAVLAVFIGRQMARPIEQLAAAAHHGGTEVEALRLAGSAPREVVELADGLRVLHRRLREHTEVLDDELQQQNAELQRTVDELTAANWDLEQFATLCSHDLQEPLRMIVSYCGLLETDYRDALDEDGREFLAYAVDGARRMQVLVNDLLAYQMLGKDDDRVLSTDLNACLAAALANLEVAIGEANATVTWDDLPHVAATASRMAQVLQNLVGNGVRYRRDGVPPQVHVSALARDGGWQVSVRDNGIGFDPRHGERIFDIFERLPGAVHRGGTGIGLAICRRIVDRYGGWIRGTGDPGRGATFTFWLPSAPAQRRAVSP